MTAAERPLGLLTNMGVLVTRPRHQAAGLCRLIAAQGGRPVAFPTIAIEPPADLAAVRARLAKIDDYRIIMFISVNAVAEGLRLLAGRPLPPQLQVGAVGRSTAAALESAGIPVTLTPEHHYDSEALLALPELQQVTGKILIVRGEGGRPLLHDALQARGAQVDYLEVYRRALPVVDPVPVLATWERDIQVVTATSNEILDNLFKLLGPAGAACIRDTPLIAVSQRGAHYAKAFGIKVVRVAERAEDQALVAALCKWRMERGRG